MEDAADTRPILIVPYMWMATSSAAIRWCSS